MGLNRGETSGGDGKVGGQVVGHGDGQQLVYIKGDVGVVVYLGYRKCQEDGYSLRG